jgi:tRNA(Ile)-lysidine synthase
LFRRGESAIANSVSCTSPSNYSTINAADTLQEKLRQYIREQRLVQAGERIAVAVSGGADSVALLRLLLELREELGIVLSVAHFHHQIRGLEADADRQFVAELAGRFSLEFHSGSADVPAYARDHKLSLESAARELRHGWFTELVHDRRADKIATAHTLDDQAETVLMRILRGTGVRGLAGIAPEQKEKHLVRPLLAVSRSEIEAYLNSVQQLWRTDSSNHDLSHTRNRVRHLLLPLLEKDFNPSIRQTLAELAQVAHLEEEYWRRELESLLPRLVRHGSPTRSGRSATGAGSATLAVDLKALQGLPLATQTLVLSAVAERLGVALEFKHIQSLTEIVRQPKRPARLPLPNGLSVVFTPRELRFSLGPEPAPVSYLYVLPIPGAVRLRELGKILQARVITAGKQKISGYNAASLLNRTLLAPELTVRNWRAGDRFFPAHSQSPKKVKELLQPGRLGSRFSAIERKLWPVAESAGEIVWMRGFPVAQAFAVQDGEAVLIEEIDDDS